MWTDNEVEMVLRLTLNYKVSKLQDSVDLESCQLVGRWLLYPDVRAVDCSQTLWHAMSMMEA